jgi:phosphate transport system substrate-binding protein
MGVEKVLLGARHRRDVQVQSSSGGVAYAVAGNRHAIGYVSLGFLSDDVKTLLVDSVPPGKETALAGSYPILRELYMFTRGDLSKEAAAFVAFVLSPAGAAHEYVSHILQWTGIPQQVSTSLRSRV